MGKIKEIIAICMYKCGRRPYVTTFIDNETLVYGYGKMNHNGRFEYSLPSRYIKFKTDW